MGLIGYLGEPLLQGLEFSSRLTDQWEHVGPETGGVSEYRGPYTREWSFRNERLQFEFFFDAFRHMVLSRPRSFFCKNGWRGSPLR